MNKHTVIFCFLSVIACSVVYGLNITNAAVTTPSIRLGSVSQGSDYIATTSDSGWANTPRTIASTTASGFSLSPGGPIQAFGSMIAGTPPTSGTIKIMDATSSTDVSSTTIAVFGPGMSTTTYTFDVRILRGLTVETPVGFVGRLTFTYR